MVNTAHGDSGRLTDDVFRSEVLRLTVPYVHQAPHDGYRRQTKEGAIDQFYEHGWILDRRSILPPILLQPILHDQILHFGRKETMGWPLEEY